MSPSNLPEASSSKPEPIIENHVQAPVSNPYYFVDDGVVFLIEQKLYRIPRSILLQSEFFRDMLQSPLLGDHEGVLEERPITPDGISRVEIESLLDLLYARALDGVPTFTLQQLSAILHLATKWGFDKARDHAIREIDKITQPPLDRLELAFKCSVPKWLRPAYEEMCTRVAALTMDEATRLGMRKFFALSQIREKRHPQGCSFSNGNTSSSYCYSCGRSNAYNSYTSNTVCVNVATELERFRDELDLDLKHHSLQSPFDQAPPLEPLGWTPSARAKLPVRQFTKDRDIKPVPIIEAPPPKIRKILKGKGKKRPRVPA